MLSTKEMAALINARLGTYTFCYHSIFSFSGENWDVGIVLSPKQIHQGKTAIYLNIYIGYQDICSLFVVGLLWCHLGCVRPVVRIVGGI